MLFSNEELNRCMLFKGCAHAYFQALMLDDEKRTYYYYLKYEV